MMAFVRKLFGKRTLLAEADDADQSEAPAPPRPPRVVRCALRTMSAPRRHATFAELLAETGTLRLMPAAFLAQKAKSVSDGILATLERFSSEGDDRNMGISAFLEELEARIAPEDPARDYLSAARDLDTHGTSAGALEFLRDSIRSKPMGFYTWSESLERVFRRDRFLQEALSDSAAGSVAGVLAADERLGVAYGQHLARIARLTNSLSGTTGSLIPRMACAREHKTFRRTPGESEVMFPPSKTIENDFTSVSDFFAAVRAGRCDLTPVASSGFYAHQLYALGPLLRPDTAPEGPTRTVDAGYAHALERLAGAALFFGRESHMKQLELAPGFPATQPERWELPGLTVEPVPTFYARTADAFRFLRVVIEEGWGEVALSAPQTREQGAIHRTVAEGIDDVVGLCEIAAALSFRELAGDTQGAEVDSMRARIRALALDADVTLDARGMVPLGFLPPPDPRVRVLVFAGWELQELEVSLTHLRFCPPGVGLGTERHPLPLPILREIAVGSAALLDRNELRRCLDDQVGDGSKL
jgi:hypothetical protein